MDIGKSQKIRVDSYTFDMILTSEEDGYCFVHRKYDLKYNGKLIAKDVHSIKSCYMKAYEFVKGEEYGKNHTN